MPSSIRGYVPDYSKWSGERWLKEGGEDRSIKTILKDWVQDQDYEISPNALAEIYVFDDGGLAEEIEWIHVLSDTEWTRATKRATAQIAKAFAAHEPKANTKRNGVAGSPSELRHRLQGGSGYVNLSFPVYVGFDTVSKSAKVSSPKTQQAILHKRSKAIKKAALKALNDFLPTRSGKKLVTDASIFVLYGMYPVRSTRFGRVIEIDAEMEVTTSNTKRRNSTKTFASSVTPLYKLPKLKKRLSTPDGMLTDPRAITHVNYSEWVVDQGKQAAQEGHPKSANPYDYKLLQDAWDAGWSAETRKKKLAKKRATWDSQPAWKRWASTRPNTGWSARKADRGYWFVTAADEKDREYAVRASSKKEAIDLIKDSRLRFRRNTKKSTHRWKKYAGIYTLHAGGYTAKAEFAGRPGSEFVDIAAYPYGEPDNYVIHADFDVTGTKKEMLIKAQEVVLNLIGAEHRKGNQ